MIRVNCSRWHTVQIPFRVYDGAHRPLYLLDGSPGLIRFVAGFGKLIESRSRTTVS